MRNKILLNISILILFFVSNSYAQLFFFGRNKIQYEKFDWKIIKTEHFDIYYYDDFREMGEIGANYAEEAFEEFKVKFNHMVVFRIPLIFYNTHIHFQQTNTTPGFIPEGVGGFFEFMKGRVVIPYLGSLEQFRHVIRHELVHVFMTSKILNNSKQHRTLADRYPPLWFVEGLAEYWSYHWDTQAEMVMRDAVLNDNFFPLDDIYKINGTFLMYKEGQNFLYFVEDEYGQDKVLELMENFWRFPVFNNNLEFTLGDRIEQIDEKWTYYLKKKYYPLYKEKFPHYIDSKKLTKEGFNFSPVFYKKDNMRTLFYIANIDGYSSVYKMDLNETSKKYLEPKRIIKGEKQEIFEAFHLLKPSLDISNQGLLVFVTKSGNSDALHLYDIENDALVNSIKFDEILTMEAPSFSKDGKQIVFSGNDKKGYVDIFVYNLENGNLNRITNDYYSDTYPVFNKDNSRVYFVSDRTEGKNKQKKNIYSIDISSRKVRYITYSDADYSSLKFDDNYNDLYFNTDIDGTFNIWKMKDVESRNADSIEEVTNFVTSVFDFTFVNNDTLITTGFEKFSFQFYMFDMHNSLNTETEKIKMEYAVDATPWKPNRIYVPSQNKKLDYKREYTLDYALSQVIADPVYGVRGGAVFLLSDLLGDDKYYFLIYNNAEVQSEILKSWNVAITKINTKYRTNFGYGIFHYSGRRYDIRESDQFFFERSYGGFFSIIYPFSTFNRLETSVTLANSDREIDYGISYRKALLLSNSISFIHDNALWVSSGPIDGSRFRLLLGYTTDIKYSNVNYYSLIADYRKYLRLGLYSALATRAAIFINDGKDARRYIAGGSWDLRGWPRWGIRGEKLWLSSIELRLPFVKSMNINFALFNVPLPSIRLAAFIDAGGAWDEKYKESIGSVGLGLRFNIFNAFIFRYDFGKKIEKNFSQFQPKMFWQFWFGWDF